MGQKETECEASAVDWKKEYDYWNDNEKEEDKTVCKASEDWTNLQFQRRKKDNIAKNRYQWNTNNLPPSSML